MIQLGVLLAVLGFGSAILHFTDVQFELLIWSERWQPELGIGIGSLGMLIIGIVWMMGRRKEEQEAQPFAGPPPGQPYRQPGGPQQLAYQPPQQQLVPAPPRQFVPQQAYRQDTPAPYGQQFPQQYPRQGPVPKFPPRPDGDFDRRGR